MEAKSGIVVKVTESYIVLIMPDGSFKNVKRSNNQVPLIGERFKYKEKRYSAFHNRWTAVAAAVCMLIAVVFTYWLLIMGNFQPAYLVALDINPSVVIYADKNLVTTSVTAVNEDAMKLINGDIYNGKNLLDTIDLIVEQSVAEGYLKQNQEGLIKITVIPMQKNNNINGDSIRTSVQELLVNDNIQADIEIGFETRDIIAEAHKSGLSMNRYILYKSLREKGVSITVEEAKNLPLKKLQNYEGQQNNNNNRRILPPPNANNAGNSGKPGNSGEPKSKQEYKDNNGQKENKNSEKPDKEKPDNKSNSETLKESDKKSKTNSSDKTGKINKEETKKSETNSSKPGQTNQKVKSIENSNKDGNRPASGNNERQPWHGPGTTNTKKH
ncbi:MAG: hypothetical protein ACM3XR_11950 [Bacillota bacterium]